jgi:hypothetical protein
VNIHSYSAFWCPLAFVSFCDRSAAAPSHQPLTWGLGFSVWVNSLSLQTSHTILSRQNICNNREGPYSVLPAGACRTLVFLTPPLSPSSTGLGTDYGEVAKLVKLKPILCVFVLYEFFNQQTAANLISLSVLLCKTIHLTYVAARLGKWMKHTYIKGPDRNSRWIEEI